MAEQQDYLDSLEEIKAVKAEEIKTCNMPFDAFIHEVKRACEVATTDLPLLTPLGYKVDNLDKLKVLIGALTVAQLNWETETSMREEASEKWQKEVPEMLALIQDLYDHMRFAYRKHPNLMKTLDEINEGESNADAVMDLGRLGTLGKSNPEPLTAIGFDVNKCDTALSESERMADLLAEANGTMYMDDERKLIRDKAYTLVKGLIDELREYGKFAFRHNEKHLKSYASKYQRDRKSEYRKNREEDNKEEVAR